MGKSEIMKIKPVRFYQSLARLRFVFITKFLGKLEFCPIAKSDSCCRFTWYRTGRNAKNILVCKPFLQMQIAADQSCPQTDSHTHCCPIVIAESNKALSWTLPSRFEYQPALSTVKQSVLYGAALSQTVPNKALSRTALIQTEYCPGQRRVKLNIVRDSTESNKANSSTCKYVRGKYLVQLWLRTALNRGLLEIFYEFLNVHTSFLCKNWVFLYILGQWMYVYAHLPFLELTQPLRWT